MVARTGPRRPLSDLEVRGKEWLENRSTIRYRMAVAVPTKDFTARVAQKPRTLSRAGSLDWPAARSFVWDLWTKHVCNINFHRTY
jgi:hypothetical protein